ncbi:MAG: D-aminoacylase [Cyclobacteriaceae bacterium]|nr:D-aminoacylase [Cyclobacteriaceae bacterium]
MSRRLFFLLVNLCSGAACFAQTIEYDLILRHGTVYDGYGGNPIVTDIAINADTIAAIGDLSSKKAKKEIDATGLAVAPGFINMLSWADGTLLEDGKGVSDIKQGITLEVFGEGLSPGPRKRKPGSKLWTTLNGYFEHLEKEMISPNVASFVGATTIRDYVIGQQNRKPTAVEMIQMKNLVKQAMEEGAMGIGSSLIYAPATFATTEELIELCKIASQYNGMYITHMRSESDKVLEAINEVIRISKDAKLPAEIYHLKINQQRNWPKIDAVLFKIDSAQKRGLNITANIYPYAASATGLKERIPIWAQEGGIVELRARIRKPDLRKRILYEMENGIPSKNSDARDVMLLNFKKDSLNILYKGKRLDQVAMLHGKNADETVLDLLLADQSSIGAVYFLISESNMNRMLQQPYVSFGTDAGAIALTPNFTDKGTHPRAYGTFPRVLGKYVRDEKLLTLQEAIRRMTTLPAVHLKIKKRGALKPGNFGDVVVFNPEKIQDHATFENPHQYSTGMIHVFVNGIQVLKDGEHTGEKPGRAVRGPGWKKNKK